MKLAKELEIPSLAQAMRHKKKVQRAIVYITSVRVIRTKKFQKMAFITFCDQNDEMEAVLFRKRIYISRISCKKEQLF